MAKQYEGCVMKWLGQDVRVMQVVVTCLTIRGKGVPDDPMTRVQEIWTMDGEKIAEYDPRLDVLGANGGPDSPSSK